MTSNELPIYLSPCIAHLFVAFAFEELNSQHLAASASPALTAVMHLAAAYAVGATPQARREHRRYNCDKARSDSDSFFLLVI